jgi:hypothetical protein
MKKKQHNLLIILMEEINKKLEIYNFSKKTIKGVDKKSEGRCCYCSNSHSVVKVIFCVNCITKYKIKFRFCGKCGAYKYLNEYPLCISCFKNKKNKEKDNNFNLPL